MNSYDIHRIMIDKGFWSNPIEDQQARTWRQLCHVADELYEVEQDILDDKDPTEEWADVCIVILDLMGAHGVHFDPCYMPDAGKPYGRIEQVMRIYRKENRLALDILARIMRQCAHSIGSVDQLCQAIDEKMRKNRARAYLYGVSKVEEQQNGK